MDNLTKSGLLIGFHQNAADTQFVHIDRSAESDNQGDTVGFVTAALNRGDNYIAVGREMIDALDQVEAEELPEQIRFDFVAPTVAVVSGFDRNSCTGLKTVFKSVVNCHRSYAQDYAAKRKFITPRESEVYELLLLGISLGQIGDRLHLSRSTVEKHKLSITRKLGVASQTELLVQSFSLHGLSECGE